VNHLGPPGAQRFALGWSSGPDSTLIVDDEVAELEQLVASETAAEHRDRGEALAVPLI
jgi:hypothetical protein